MGWANWHALRSIVWRTSREATRPDHELAELRTRFLPLPRKLAWRTLSSAVSRLAQAGAGWRIEEESPQDGQIRLVRSRMLRWCVSDVVVSLWPAESACGPLFGVDIVSASRGGAIDFGQNARNVRDFYRVLEATVSASVESASGRTGRLTRDVAEAAFDHKCNPRVADADSLTAAN